jgi:hypothetical protein
MNDADIVVTHTPAYGHCDIAANGDRSGCPVLTRRLAEIRPVMHVCGHIHDARGVERVQWTSPSSHTTPPSSSSAADTLCLVDSTTQWTDPGKGNKKMALVDLTAKGWAMDNSARGGVTRHGLSDSLRERLDRQPDAAVVEYQPGAAKLATEPSSLTDSALLDASEAGVECVWRRKAGGAIECRCACDVGRSVVDAHSPTTTSTGQRMETAMINAAFLGQRVENKASKTFNKPIIVDVELPVWELDSER